MNKLRALCKKDPILVISGLLALLSMLFVAPDAAYLGYIDFRVLALLFCLMCVVNGFQEIGAFQWLAVTVLGKTRTNRQLAFVLVGLCFIGSMLITNDVALLTFVPFTVLVLTITDKRHLMGYVIVLQTIAANLGSMLTPVGNPQNLYLYSLSGMNLISFVGYTLPFCVFSLILLLLALLPIKKETICLETDSSGLGLSSLPFVNKKELAKYLLLFLVCMGCVAHFLPWQAMFAFVFLVLLLSNRGLLIHADYGLLCTFLFFFLFIGNMGRLPAVAALLEQILAGHELPVSVAASQIISNVPAAVLLSGFTGRYRPLLIGVNLGGLGTLIASLASLISYKQYVQTEGAQKGAYLRLFTLMNLAFLAPLFLFALAVLHFFP